MICAVSRPTFFCVRIVPYFHCPSSHLSSTSFQNSTSGSPLAFPRFPQSSHLQPLSLDHRPFQQASDLSFPPVPTLHPLLALVNAADTETYSPRCPNKPSAIVDVVEPSASKEICEPALDERIPSKPLYSGLLS